MYEDSPDWRGYMNLVRGLFVRHAVRTDVTGSVESIARIDRDVLVDCHRHFYAPANLCLAVSGDVDPAAIADVAAAEMASEGGRGPAQRLSPSEPTRVAQRRSTATYPIGRPRLLIGFKDPAVPLRGEELRRRDLETGLLLDLMFGFQPGTDNSPQAIHGVLYAFGPVTAFALAWLAIRRYPLTRQRHAEILHALGRVQ